MAQQRTVSNREALILSITKATVVASLCTVLAGQPLFAAAAAKKPAKPAATPKSTEIQGDDRVLHALNRLTFGPRPGEVQAVDAIGLNAWFERQLNPAAIDDSALDTRLAAYPAMQLSQEDLMQRFPNPAVIRQMVLRDRAALAMPTDPTLHAVYADQIAFYQLRLDTQKAATASGTTVPKKKNYGVRFGNPADMAAQNGEMSATKPAADPNDMAMAPAMDDKAAALAQAKADNADPLAFTPDEHVDTLYPQEKAQTVLALAPDARMQAILAMPAKELAQFRRSLSKRELAQLTVGLSPSQRETLLSLGGSQRVVGTELLQTRLLRDIYSDRELEAVMTDFWLNHFNVYVKKSQVEPYLIPSFERDVIRPNALGKFEDLLVATAKSPAMLVYLDNARSSGANSPQARRFTARQASMPENSPLKKANEGLNENYARELMELHTLGVGGGYTQADVTQVAKVFTGWTIDRPYQGGDYQFAANRHEPGSKQVLGKTIDQNGEKEGLEVLHMLATSPATAKFISTKLAVRFVSDTPPPALVDRMSQAFLTSNGDIKTVLRTMFQSPEFWSPAVYRAKVKTPIEFVVSAVRASDANVVNPQPLVQALDKLGMPLYGMQTPNGYSWKESEWVSTGALVSRMNFALVLSGDKIGGVRTQWPNLLAEATPVAKRVDVEMGASEDPSAKEKRLELILLGDPVSPRTRATVLAQFDDQTTKDNAAKEFDLHAANPEMAGAAHPAPIVRRNGQLGPQDPQAAGMAGLLLGSPEFQRR